MSASPHAIMVGGMIQGVFVVVAIAMALTGRRRAPEAAIAVGFGSAVLFTYAHLLPSVLSGLPGQLRLRPAHQRDMVLLDQRRRRDRHRHRVRDRRLPGSPPVRRKLGGATTPTAGGIPMNATAGTLFFDGACGMCTRSKDLLLKFDRTGNIRDRAAAEPRSRGTTRRRTDEPARFGAMAGFFGHGLLRRGGRQRGALQRRSAPESRWRSTGFPASASSRTSSTGGWSHTGTGSREPRRTASRTRPPARPVAAGGAQSGTPGRSRPDSRAAAASCASPSSGCCRRGTCPASPALPGTPTRRPTARRPHRTTPAKPRN